MSSSVNDTHGTDGPYGTNVTNVTGTGGSSRSVHSAQSQRATRAARPQRATHTHATHATHATHVTHERTPGAAMITAPDSPALFSILSSLVAERTGLNYGAAERDLFFERVEGRAREAGFDSLLDYYYFLRYDPGAAAEMRALAEALVVNETFFFREIEPLRVMVARFLWPLVRAGVRPRLWSAACSTGEEPLTVAMLLAEAGLLRDVDLVASDISERALARARGGRFSARAVRDGNDPHLTATYLTKQPTGEWIVSPELIDAIQWRRVNLTEQEVVAAQGHFDVILCRNVLIYFSDDTVVRVLRSLSDVLRPQGAIFVGVSESLLRFGTMLTCEERDRVFFYRHAR